MYVNKALRNPLRHSFSLTCFERLRKAVRVKKRHIFLANLKRILNRRVDSRGGRGGSDPPKKYALGGPKSNGPPNKNGTCLLFITNTDKITFLSCQIFLSQNLENRISQSWPRFLVIITIRVCITLS